MRQAIIKTAQTALIAYFVWVVLAESGPQVAMVALPVAIGVAWMLTLACVAVSDASRFMLAPGLRGLWRRILETHMEATGRSSVTARVPTSRD